MTTEEASTEITTQNTQDTVPDIDTTTTITLDGSLLQPVNGVPDSKLDDSEVSELSSRFVDAIGLLPKQDELPIINEQTNAETKEQDPAIVAAEKKAFDDSMEVISRFSEDVIKTWFSQIYKKDLTELFPDGLLGHTASIKMIPSKELLKERRESRRDEEQRDQSDDALGWELKLIVVDGSYRADIEHWKKNEPAIVGQMQSLLKTAWGYIQYALERYEMPNIELFKNKVIPTPWGTLTILGAPDDAPQIGVSITRPKHDPNTAC